MCKAKENEMPATQENCGDNIKMPAETDFYPCKHELLSSDSVYVLNLMPDAIAILNDKNEICWCNGQFQEWFPNSRSLKETRDVLTVIGHPIFLPLEGFEEDVSEISGGMYAVNSCENETSGGNRNLCEEEAVNPFIKYRTTLLPSKGAMQLSNGRYLEVQVHPWQKNFMMFLVHEATERRELKERLKNLHSVCESLSHADELKGMTSDERRAFLIEGIQYMAKSLFHYEVLEVRKFNPETNELELFSHYGIVNEAVTRQLHPDTSDNGTIGYVAVTRQSYLCNDTRKDPHYLLGGNEMLSSLTVPILFQGELLGILSTESSHLNAFDEMDRLYTEIFVHEIALAMNVMHLLDVGTTTGRQMSVEEIHGKVALPIKKILNLSVELYNVLDETQIEAQHLLYQVIKEARSVNQMIRAVGRNLPMNQASSDREILVQKWRSTFEGKRILLVDTDPKLFKDGEELFDLLDCDLDVATTGEMALQKLEIAIKSGMGYYAILASTSGIPGYPHTTQFMLDLGKIYGTVHPPLVMLSEECCYDGDHTVVNTRLRYPVSGWTRKPFIENMLLEITVRTVGNAKVTPPRMIPIPGEYHDDLLEKLGPQELKNE